MVSCSNCSYFQILKMKMKVQVSIKNLCAANKFDKSFEIFEIF